MTDALGPTAGHPLQAKPHRVDGSVGEGPHPGNPGSVYRIDHVYSRHFGWKVQNRLQKAIRDHHHGELLIGAAEVVETDDARIPFLIAAPTMRLPMILGDSVNPYLAVRATLLLIQGGTILEGNFAGHPLASVISTVAFPGMGTGVGRVLSETCARQVRAALMAVLHGPMPFPSSWADAQRNHQLLYSDRVRDLQRQDGHQR